MDDPLRLGSLRIPAGELRWTFDTAGGPGGQHANRAATRAEVSFDLGASPSVPDDLKRRMLARLGSRARSGVVTVAADDTRSQWRNRALARKRLQRLLSEAVHRPRRRIATLPSAASRRRRLQEKRRRAEVKRRRRRPEPDE
jgi:ribosome-associated protein